MLTETQQSPKLAARICDLISRELSTAKTQPVPAPSTESAPVASIGEGANSNTDPLTKYAAMIARAEAGTLPQTGRVVLPAGCLGMRSDDHNIGVRGAASILRDCKGTDEKTLTLRESAANDLRVMAVHFAEYFAGGDFRNTTRYPEPAPVPTPNPEPKQYTGNRAKALAAMRGLPGYLEPERTIRKHKNDADTPQEVGLF